MAAEAVQILVTFRSGVGGQGAQPFVLHEKKRRIAKLMIPKIWTKQPSTLDKEGEAKS